MPTLSQLVLIVGCAAPQESASIDPAARIRIEAGSASPHDDILLRRAEDLTPRTPNPNGSNAGVTPGMSKNDYVTKTYAVRNTDAIELQSYLLRALAYEGGVAEVMGRRDVVGPDGKSVQFLFVTAPDFMIPGIDAMVAQVDIPGFRFHDGTGNASPSGQLGCLAYVGKHRTAGELRSILIGSELGNVGQLYVAPFADPALNAIYINDNPTDIVDDLSALEGFDRPPLQAEFTVRIFALEEDRLADLSVDVDTWKRGLGGNVTFRSATQGGGPSTLAALLQWDAAVLVDFLDFLVRDGKAEVTMDTRLLSINAEDNPGALSGGAKGSATATPAVLRNVRTVPTPVTPMGTPDAADAGIVVERVVEGVEVTILPFIATESLTADITVQVTSQVGLAADSRTPLVSTHQTRSVANLTVGRTVLLGSYERTVQIEQVGGVWLLRDIPLLGALFRRETRVARDSRLLVFLTPRVGTSKPAEEAKLSLGNSHKPAARFATPRKP